MAACSSSTLTVEPLGDGDGGEPLYLVLFADHGRLLTATRR